MGKYTIQNKNKILLSESKKITKDTTRWLGFFNRGDDMQFIVFYTRDIP